MESQILSQEVDAERPDLRSAVKTVTKEYKTLNLLISTGRSKEFLGRDIALKDLDVMDQDTIEAYYKIYELNYSNKISENIISSIIGSYAKVVNRILPIDDVNKLEQDLNNDYILTTELKNITGSMAVACGKLMSLFSLSFITFMHIKAGNLTAPLAKDKEELAKEL